MKSEHVNMFSDTIIVVSTRMGVGNTLGYIVSDSQIV